MNSLAGGHESYFNFLFIVHGAVLNTGGQRHHQWIDLIFFGYIPGVGLLNYVFSCVCSLVHDTASVYEIFNSCEIEHGNSEG